MPYKKFGALSSSADPSKLAATVKGALIAILPIVIILAQRFDVTLAESDLAQLIEVGSIIASACVMGFGLVRKIYIAIVSRD